MKQLAAVAAALILLGPTAALVGIGVLMNPAAAACTTGDTLTLGAVPDTLTATTRDGQTVTLDRSQLTHAATIIKVADQTAGVGRQGALIALMAALTESGLRQLANTTAYPESAGYPHDGDGSDHDSLGLFQMRPASGWGSVAQLMDPTYQARAFYGGPDGPNHGSPRGLLDIPGWQQADPGAAAQAVEVSAYPDRYQNWQPVAEQILTTLTTTNPDSSKDAATQVAETSRIVFPLPAGSWVKTSGWGMRVNPVTGQDVLHEGTDYAAPDGTPIYAIADGVVTQANYDDRYGGVIAVLHTVDGQPVASVYRHMWKTGILVAAGDRVTAGQQIGQVGPSGQSTGSHLHFKIHPGGPDATTVDSDQWLTAHHAQSITTPTGSGTAANASGTACAATGENP